MAPEGVFQKRLPFRRVAAQMIKDENVRYARMWAAVGQFVDIQTKLDLVDVQPMPGPPAQVFYLDIVKPRA